MSWRRRSERQGFTLVELAVAMGIMAILVLGIASVMWGLYRQTSYARTTGALESLRNRFQGYVIGKESWIDIMSAPAPNDTMQCLRDNTLCADAGPLDFAIYDGTGNIFYDPTDADQGFTHDGESCSIAALGPNICGIRYSATWRPLCAVPCASPEVELNITPTFSPEFLAEKFAVDYTRFRLLLSRPVGNLNEVLVVTEHWPDGAPTGACAATGGFGTSRSFNTILQNPSANVIDLTGGLVHLRKGYYVCSVQVPGYDVNGFRIRIFNVTSGAQVGGIGMSYAVFQSQSLARLTVGMDLTVDTQIRVDQDCESASPTGYSLGLPIPTGAGPSYTGGSDLSIMSCTRVN